MQTWIHAYESMMQQNKEKPLMKAWSINMINEYSISVLLPILCPQPKPTQQNFISITGIPVTTCNTAKQLVTYMLPTFCVLVTCMWLLNSYWIGAKWVVQYSKQEQRNCVNNRLHCWEIFEWILQRDIWVISLCGPIPLLPDWRMQRTLITF